MSVTVYMKHVQQRFNLLKTVSALQTLESELKKETASKQWSFLKELCSKSTNCSRTLPKTGLSVTNSLVYGAVLRIGGPLTNFLMTEWYEWCVALPHAQCGQYKTHWAIKKSYKGGE